MDFLVTALFGIKHRQRTRVTSIGGPTYSTLTTSIQLAWMHRWDLSLSINIRGWQSIYTWHAIKAETGDVWMVQIGERNSCIMNQCVRRKPPLKEDWKSSFYTCDAWDWIRSSGLPSCLCFPYVSQSNFLGISTRCPATLLNREEAD